MSVHNQSAESIWPYMPAILAQRGLRSQFDAKGFHSLSCVFLRCDISLEKKLIGVFKYWIMRGGMAHALYYFINSVSTSSVMAN